MTIIYGTSGNDILSGTSGSDSIYAQAGNDYLIGGDFDYLYGENGDDTYDYVGGRLTYSETSGNGFDRILFNTSWLTGGFDFSAMTYYRNINNDLVMDVDSSGYNQMIIKDHFVYSNNSIEILDLSDGRIIDLTTKQYETKGTNGDNIIFGIVSNGSINDVIYGYDGNDQLYGGNGNDYLDGGNGNDILAGDAGDDVFFYSAGLDAFSDSSGNDILKLASGIDLSDLTFARDTNNNLVITIDTNNQMTLTQFFNYQNEVIETLHFYDNSTLSLTTQQYETHGTTSDNIIFGIVSNGSTNDVIYGHGGNDELYGGNGNDKLYGGDGLDNLNGGVGSDVFVFEADSAFNNTDIIQDFSKTDNDKLDISDLLIGYDSVTSDINDFLSLSISGSNATLSVDRDGTGSSYSDQSVALLYNSSSLTINDLFNNGHIIA